MIKHALKYTGSREGWILSEFLGPVGYSAPHGGIVAAAAHHIREAIGSAISAWQSWRTEDPRLTVAIEAPPQGLVPVEPGTAVEVTTTITADTTTVVSPSLLVPENWKAVPQHRVRPTAVKAGRTLRTRWLVTAPSDLPRHLPQPLRLLVRSQGRRAECFLTSVVNGAQAG